MKFREILELKGLFEPRDAYLDLPFKESSE